MRKSDSFLGCVYYMDMDSAKVGTHVHFMGTSSRFMCNRFSARIRRKSRRKCRRRTLILQFRRAICRKPFEIGWWWRLGGLLVIDVIKKYAIVNTMMTAHRSDTVPAVERRFGGTVTQAEVSNNRSHKVAVNVLRISGEMTNFHFWGGINLRLLWKRTHQHNVEWMDICVGDKQVFMVVLMSLLSLPRSFVEK